MADDIQQGQAGYAGQADATVPEGFYNSLSFMVNQIMNGKWTITVAKVMAVHDGGTAGPPTVDVQPMINQINGSNETTPHGTIYGLPVFRLQGGSWGVIADPQADDIGIMACAMRDISAVVKTKEVSNPGSKRTYSPSDGIYIGSLLCAELTQYVQFSETGIKVLDKNGNTIETTSDGVLITPASGKPVTVDGDLVVSGEVSADGEVTAKAAVPAVAVKLSTHVHTSAAPGNPTTPPTPGT